MYEGERALGLGHLAFGNKRGSREGRSGKFEVRSVKYKVRCTKVNEPWALGIWPSAIKGEAGKTEVGSLKYEAVGRKSEDRSRVLEVGRQKTGVGRGKMGGGKPKSQGRRSLTLEYVLDREHKIRKLSIGSLIAYEISVPALGAAGFGTVTEGVKKRS